MFQEKVVRSPGDSLLASEIAQQPLLWPTTLEHVRAAATTLKLADRPVILTGAGTSAYAALAIADAWPGARAIATTDLVLQSAKEIAVALPSFPDNGLLISLARSGESPESVGVVERLQKFFPAVEHVAIICNPEGRLAHTSGVHAIRLDPRTNDRSLAMTSSFSNLALGGLCLLHAEDIAKSLPAICARVSGSLNALNAVAQQIAGACVERIIFLTSSMHALALEASIKVIELTAGRVTVLHETFLGLRHGPLSFATADTLVVCFTSSDARKRRYELGLLEDLREKGLGKLIVVGEDAAAWPVDWFVPAIAPELPDHLRTPFELLFAQLLAYHLSLHVQVDPDNPSPGGVVTRVVKPFKLYGETE